MATFVVVHGAWSAAWAWKKMRPLLRERGHELFTPTHTGLGERSHLARPAIDLEVHIADVLGVLRFEDLRDVFLVGHSYGGMVATGVADRAAERVAHLVYLDAFVPRDGQSLANPMPPDASADDLAWAAPLRMMQPLRTFEQKLRLTGAVDRLPRSYIYCTRQGPGDVFRQLINRARTEQGWTYFELDASHNPHITIPEALAALLDDLTSGTR